jgi:hypothetical protein
MPVTLIPIPTEKGMTPERISISTKRLTYEKTRYVIHPGSYNNFYLRFFFCTTGEEVRHPIG